jgi:hypothetical protein
VGVEPDYDCVGENSVEGEDREVKWERVPA